MKKFLRIWATFLFLTSLLAVKGEEIESGFPEITMIPSILVEDFSQRINSITDLDTASRLYMSGFYDAWISGVLEEPMLYDKNEKNGIWYNYGIDDARKLQKKHGFGAHRYGAIEFMGFNQRKIVGILTFDQTLLIRPDLDKKAKVFMKKDLREKLNTSIVKYGKGLLNVEITGWISSKSSYIYPPVVGGTFMYLIIANEVEIKPQTVK